MFLYGFRFFVVKVVGFMWNWSRARNGSNFSNTGSVIGMLHKSHETQPPAQHTLQPAFPSGASAAAGGAAAAAAGASAANGAAAAGAAGAAGAAAASAADPQGGEVQQARPIAQSRRGPRT